jgi:hypothetical protein
VKKQKKKKEKQEKVSQLDLGIKEPFINKFFKIKGNVDFALLKFEVKRFLKDPLVWAAFVISVILIGQQIILIYKNIHNMPVYIPVFRYFISIPKKLVSKEYIFIFPSISIFSFILSFIFTSRYYNSEKSLTKFLLFGLLLCTLSQTIILIDLVKFF